VENESDRLGRRQFTPNVHEKVLTVRRNHEFLLALPQYAQVGRDTRALGAARSGDPASAENNVRKLAEVRDALKAAKDNYWATEVEVSRLGAAAWTAWAGGKHDDALAMMRSAADIEDKNEKHIVTPVRILPARELLGEMLLELKRPADALEEFEGIAGTRAGSFSRPLRCSSVSGAERRHQQGETLFRASRGRRWAGRIAAGACGGS
jgi:hypothetical protein